MDKKDLFPGCIYEYESKTCILGEFDQYGYTYIYVNNCEKFVPFEQIKPLEITDKWLMDNGFSGHKSIQHFGGEDVFLDNKPKHIQMQYDMANSKKYWFQVDNDRCESIGSFEADYVHELQIMYYLLTGKDLL